VKLAKLYSVPVVHSTIQVASGREAPTLPELAELLEDDPPVDRTTMNTRTRPGGSDLRIVHLPGA
jgi:hypothetical protein